MPGPEIHHKMTEVNGLTVLQVLFENLEVCQPSMADRIWENHNSSNLKLGCISACIISIGCCCNRPRSC